MAFGVKYTAVTLYRQPPETRLSGLDVHFAAGVVTAVASTTSKVRASEMTHAATAPAFDDIEHTFERLLNKYGCDRGVAADQLELVGHTQDITVTAGRAQRGRQEVHAAHRVRCKYLELYGRHEHRVAVVHNGNNSTGAEEHGDHHHCKYDVGARACLCLCHWREPAALGDGAAGVAGSGGAPPAPPQLALQLLR